MRIELLTVALVIATRPVCAQTPPPQPVSQILPNLFGNTIVLTPTGTPEFPNHSAHFKPGAEQLQTPTRFNEQIVTLLATLPVGSSSGGFTYTFNPDANPAPDGEAEACGGAAVGALGPADVRCDADRAPRREHTLDWRRRSLRRRDVLRENADHGSDTMTG